MFSSFENFTNNDIINFLKKQGLEVKIERGNRYFPITDKSIDVLNCFKMKLEELNVQIRYNEVVKKILTKKEDGEIIKVEGIETSKEKIKADKVILATGGNSYQATGSTGEGYKMASQVGHTITKIVPSLVPMVVNDINKVESNNEVVSKSTYKNSLNLCKAIQGLSLKNVGIKILDIHTNKVVYEDFGEMIFTHFGVSGPTILSGSAHLLRYKNVDELFKNGKIILKIDLKPALSDEKLDLRILRDFDNEKNKCFKNSLNELLPQKLIEPVINLCGIDGDKKVNEITKSERLKLVSILKNFSIIISGFRDINEAIVTSGGVTIKEINPKTMESKLVKGLFFAGEVIDVDAYTGGFNLQIAYSTGYTAGMNKD